MKKILLVEDNEAIVKGLKYTFDKEGFQMNFALTIKEAEEQLKKIGYDLIVLDVSLPDGNGFDLCKKLKQVTTIPIIFLTAKDEEKDVVLGFDTGADDYIIKPFRSRELISRINRIFRTHSKEENFLQCNNISIYLDSARVFIGTEEVLFTPLEYKILVMLFSNMNHIVTRELILDKIWDISGNYVNDNTLTVYIKRIRSKLGNENKDIIKTIKGIGYRVDQC